MASIVCVKSVRGSHSFVTGIGGWTPTDPPVITFSISEDEAVAIDDETADAMARLSNSQAGDDVERPVRVIRIRDKER